LVSPSNFITSLRPYAFAEIDKARDELERRGVDVIDFGVGDPTSPTPEFVRSECKRALDRRSRSGYPSYQGSPEFRSAVSAWVKRRFGARLDPENEITATIGLKQAIFMLPLAYVNPGDVVLVPDPGYPPYTTGALSRGARCHYLPLREGNSFFPELSGIPSETSSKAKLLWINYPNNPTTKIASEAFLREAVDYCRDHEVLLASDEAYSELYYDKKPTSVLSIPGSEDVSLIFNSMSKRSSMTGYRIGFAAGRKEILDPLKKVQTQVHSGAATFIQDCAVAALSDEDHVHELREQYRQKRDMLIESLGRLGLESIYAEATFYIWARSPPGMDSIDFTKLLLEKAYLNTVPGKALCQETDAGENFVRFALVPDIDATEEACRRIDELEM